MCRSMVIHFSNYILCTDLLLCISVNMYYIQISGCVLKKICIMFRSMVVHEMIDDLGLGGAENSLTTGNSGERSAHFP